ncbi:MAG TPA: EamA family transporter RarD [Chloroflexi bacterium]|nr:EamA family transporter RarD [Chloroflexota bacterium]
MDKKGIIATIVAYTVWGALPAYWKLVQQVPALQILGHRTVWSFVFLLVLLTWRKQWTWLAMVRERPRVLGLFLLTGSILGLNWFLYIWSVNAGRVLDASLGYFINPLLSVLLGVVFLKEQLRPGQWVAIGLAGVGVVYLTVSYGAFPAVALTLALTFGLYGLFRKTAPLASVEGLALETTFMSVPALSYLVYLEWTNAGAFGQAEWGTRLLLALTGLATALPLLSFTYGARRIPLSAVGILQYIAPTLQFLLGVFAYQEPFSRSQLFGFSVIWLALLVYSVEGIWMAQRKAKAPRSAIVPGRPGN